MGWVGNRTLLIAALFGGITALALKYPRDLFSYFLKNFSYRVLWWFWPVGNLGSDLFGHAVSRFQHLHLIQPQLL